MAQFRKDTHKYLDQEKTIFEVVMLSDQYGNLVGPANPSGAAVDAFGRARMSQPLTLFDSFHRYRENDKWYTSNTAANTSTCTYNANSSTISMSVTTSNGANVLRETSRTFAYQPGKSLQILNTFDMAPAQTGLTQKIGYFGTQNGVYLEQANSVVSFVVRSYSTGTLVEDRINQSSWNIDALDGTGPSLLTLDVTKSQIFWADIEWLGVGTVRCGFVIDGRLIHCHSFHHANKTVGTYMTTACLPLRAEIYNTANTGNVSTMNVICNSVISEGGYDLRGDQYSAGQLPNASYTLTTAGVFYPVVAIRLRSDRPDAIVIPTNFSVLGLLGNGSRIAYKIVDDAIVSGGTWINADNEHSSVQYNITANTLTGGDTYTQAFQAVNNQGSVAGGSLGRDIFRHQLKRNTFTGANSVLVLAVAGAGNGDTCIAALDWEEIT
jgi:hypothetical protein